jgi:hypothetical protein
MTCLKFDEFAEGKMSPKTFARHIRECLDCRAEAERDRRLTEEIPMLQTRLESPDLWSRIEVALRAEAAATSDSGVRDGSARRPVRSKRFRFWPLAIPAAAGAVLVVAVTVFLPSKSVSSSGLLARQTLAKVDAQEKAYLQAIGDLENLARTRISAMDLSLMSLYRDRLAVIDAQIEKCREALGSNPANAHIRRYLLAALQDKKATLAEVLGS